MIDLFQVAWTAVTLGLRGHTDTDGYTELYCDCDWRDKERILRVHWAIWTQDHVYGGRNFSSNISIFDDRLLGVHGDEERASFELVREWEKTIRLHRTIQFVRALGHCHGLNLYEVDSNGLLVLRDFLLEKIPDESVVLERISPEGAILATAQRLSEKVRCRTSENETLGYLQWPMTSIYPRFSVLDLSTIKV